MKEMILEIFELCIIPLLGILTKYLVSYLAMKSNEIQANTDSVTAKKYLDMVYNTVVSCVIATNQTYVESLKQSGSFDEDAQKQAFEKTMEAVLAVLNDETKKYITSITGDLNTYLSQLIEAEVNRQK